MRYFLAAARAASRPLRVHPRAILVFAVGFGLLGAAGLYANAQLSRAGEGRTTASTLTRLHIETNAVSAALWKFIATSGGGASRANLERQLAAADASAETVLAADGDDDDVQELAANYYTYRAALGREVEFINAGAFGQARELDQSVIDHTYGQLIGGLLSESQAHHRQAASEERATFMVAGIAALFATLLAVTASLRVLSARGAARHAAAGHAALEASEARFRALVQNATDLVTVVNQEGVVTYASPPTLTVMGYDSASVVGRGVMRLIHPDDRPLAAVAIAGAVQDADSEAATCVLRMRHADGEFRYIEGRVRNLLNDAAVNGLVLNSRDVTARVLADAEEDRLTSIITATTDVVTVTGVDLRVTFMNRAGRSLLGAWEEEVPLISQFVPPAAWREIELAALPEVLSFGSWSGESSLLNVMGDLVAVELDILGHRGPHGGVEYLSWIARDVTERKRFESQLVYLANHDSLTGLYNRRRFEDELKNELARARRTGSAGALLFLDIDNFKAVNDELGHRAGDELLRSVTAALKELIPDAGVLGRLGGDEFAILLEGADAPSARAIAEEVRMGMRNHRVRLEGQTVSITVSIGVALIPEHGHSSQDLLMHADLAMYEAKEDRDGVHLYSPTSDYGAELTQRRVWEERLRHAIEHDELVLEAQPVVGAPGSVEQYELLVRMQGEDGTLIQPVTFLPFAERSGLIHLLDRWVLRQAIGLIKAHATPRRPLALAVNISARSLKDEGIPRLIAAEIARTGINPASLILEITETAAIADIDEARRFIDPLKRLGCRFAIDDFGAGFASFNYLKHLPVDHVKIDGSFIRNLPRDRQDQHLVRAMVEVAHGLGKETVAEFVEDAETLSILRGFGVEYMQGFFLGRPRPVLEMLTAYAEPYADAA